MAIGKKFVSWGLGLFVFGIFLSFGIIAHYCVGAAWPTGELFKQNITLWWACPWTLSVGNCSDRRARNGCNRTGEDCGFAIVTKRNWQ